MARVITAVILLSVLSSPVCGAHPSDLPPLPELASTCEVRDELISVQDEALFVRCKDVKFRIYHPSNLFGHVRISNAHSALMFVRFFTSRRTFHLVGLHGDVEVRAKGDAVSADAFSATKAVPGGFPIRMVESVDSVEGRIFLIERYVVSLDQTIYRVKERVTEHGSYALNERFPVHSDAGRIGIVHIGRH